jgi:hypothetical protein
MASRISLFLLPAELLGGVAVLWEREKASTRANADAASFDADGAMEMPIGATLDDGEACYEQGQPKHLIRALVPSWAPSDAVMVL